MPTKYKHLVFKYQIHKYAAKQLLIVKLHVVILMAIYQLNLFYGHPAYSVRPMCGAATPF